ncbi:hypothetical protein BGZ83_003589, partial [Gryganskiella cystojenkinii]
KKPKSVKSHTPTDVEDSEESTSEDSEESTSEDSEESTSEDSEESTSEDSEESTSEEDVSHKDRKQSKKAKKQEPVPKIKEPSRSKRNDSSDEEASEESVSESENVSRHRRPPKKHNGKKQSKKGKREDFSEEESSPGDHSSDEDEAEESVSGDSSSHEGESEESISEEEVPRRETPTNPRDSKQSKKATSKAGEQALRLETCSDESLEDTPDEFGMYESKKDRELPALMFELAEKIRVVKNELKEYRNRGWKQGDRHAKLVKFKEQLFTEYRNCKKRHLKKYDTEEPTEQVYGHYKRWTNKQNKKVLDEIGCLELDPQEVEDEQPVKETTEKNVKQTKRQHLPQNSKKDRKTKREVATAERSSEEDSASDTDQSEESASEESTSGNSSSSEEEVSEEEPEWTTEMVDAYKEHPNVLWIVLSEFHEQVTSKVRKLFSGGNKPTGKGYDEYKQIINDTTTLQKEIEDGDGKTYDSAYKLEKRINRFNNNYAQNFIMLDLALVIRNMKKGIMAKAKKSKEEDLTFALSPEVRDLTSLENIPLAKDGGWVRYPFNRDLEYASNFTINGKYIIKLTRKNIWFELCPVESMGGKADAPDEDDKERSILRKMKLRPMSEAEKTMFFQGDQDKKADEDIQA